MSNFTNSKQKFPSYDYKKYKQRYYKHKTQLKQKQQQAYYNCYSYYYPYDENEPSYNYNYYYNQQQQQQQKSQQPVKQQQAQTTQVDLNYDFNKLPNIVLKNVYSYLTLKEKLVASSTCSNWRNALYHPALWQNFTLRIYLCYNEDTQSAYYKARAFGKYINKLIIHFEPNDFSLLQELANILEIIKVNRNISEISLFPMYNTGDDDYLYSNSKLINIDLANKRVMKNLTEIIQNTLNLEHLTFGCNINFLCQNFNETLNDLCIKHDNKLKSLHLSSIKNQRFNVKNGYNRNYNQSSQNSLQQYHQRNILNLNSTTDNHLVKVYLLKFTNLEYLSIDYEHLSSELLKSICSSKTLKELNINVSELDTPTTTATTQGQTNRITDDTWLQVKQENPLLRVNINIIGIQDLPRKYDQILKAKIPVEKLRLFFCKSLNPDLLQFVRDNYCDTLKTLCVIDAITDPTLRYHNPFRNDADPLVLLAWKCKYLEELTLIGYEVLQINLTAIAQLRNNLKVFHIPMDCVITLRYGEFDTDDDFFEDEDGDDTVVDYGICSNQVISKVSKTLGYNWHLLYKDELPLCIYDYEMPYEEVIFECLINEQYSKKQ